MRVNFLSLSSLLFISFLPFIASAQLPLMQISDMTYEGAFIVPSGTFGESTSSYSAGAFALSADKKRFYLAGHGVHGAIAEFVIPEIVKSDSLQDLYYATIEQDFKSFMDLTPDGNPQNINRIAGMKIVNNRLLVNAVEYYNAPADNTHTTFVVEDAGSLATSEITGYYQVAGAAHAGGWISDVPSEWSAALGGDYIMGNSSKFPINSRSTMGVSAFVFDPAELVNNSTAVIPSTVLMDFDLENPLYEDFENYESGHYNLTEINGTTPPGHTFADADAIVGSNNLWTSESQASFGFIIPGTRTYMSIGSSGGHNSGIGYKPTQNNGNVCGGPCPYDAEDIYNHYWLWDLDDLVDVKNGVKLSYEVRPYDHGILDLPLQYDDYYSAPEFHHIVGGDYDADNGILYLTLYDGGASGSPYSRNPAILAYRINSAKVAVNPTLSLEALHTGFDQPTKITHAGDGSGRIFVAEKSGKIKVIDSTGIILFTPFLDISGLVSTSNDQGLLGLAFHPDYVNNGYFYVNYTKGSGNTEIVRYQVSTSNTNLADITSAQLILDYQQPTDLHNGGDINFGPQDGFLYIASGDGGSINDADCEAQDTTSMLGKILRIDINVPNGNPATYLIPSDNPYSGEVGAEETIWAYGLQNPWRFSFDKFNGDLWISDIGQNIMEEVNYDAAPLTGGRNYGWKYMEGSECIIGNTNDSDCNANTPICGSPLYKAPLFEYRHDAIVDGGTNIVGGHVYRGCNNTALYGLYICADATNGNFWTMDKTGSKQLHQALLTGVTTFGEDEEGELYCATMQGEVFKVMDIALPEVITLTTANSPLVGTFRANSSIVVDGALDIEDGKIVTLIAPDVIIKDGITAEDSERLIIKKVGCN